MSLQPSFGREVPEETARVAQAIYPKGNLFMRLRDELGDVFEDATFAELYPQSGQHSLSPSLLALVLVMQYIADYSDRQAAEAVRDQISWKYALGLEVVCPPRQPWKKPYVERCVRTFKYEWLDRFSLNTMADCYEALTVFPNYHNHERKHMGRACQGKTPEEAFPVLPILPELPQVVARNRWLGIEHGRVFQRRIRANGTIQVDKHTYYIDQKLAKCRVLLHLDGHNQCLHITLDGKMLPKSLPLKAIQPNTMDLQDYLKVLQQETMSIAAYHRMVWMQSADAA